LDVADVEVVSNVVHVVSGRLGDVVSGNIVEVWASNNPDKVKFPSRVKISVELSVVVVSCLENQDKV